MPCQLFDFPKSINSNIFSLYVLYSNIEDLSCEIFKAKERQKIIDFGYKRKEVAIQVSRNFALECVRKNATKSIIKPLLYFSNRQRLTKMVLRFFKNHWFTKVPEQVVKLTLELTVEVFQVESLIAPAFLDDGAVDDQSIGSSKFSRVF